MTTQRAPVVFLPHGGGPWPWMEPGTFGPKSETDAMAAYLRGLAGLPATPPKAVLMISAHWEEGVPTVQTSPKPPMLYDYSGFPAHTYTIQWPAPGAPEVAGQVQEVLKSAGIASNEDPNRGFDHGAFVPLALAYPDADVPTFQLSLIKGLDPVAHLELGRALAPLREQGVYIVASGMSYHNMYGFFGRVRTAVDDSKRFDDWLQQVVSGDAEQRDAALGEWTKAPRARACHPREEHLLPLMVAAGAAQGDTGSIAFRGTVAGTHVSGVTFA